MKDFKNLGEIPFPIGVSKIPGAIVTTLTPNLKKIFYLQLILYIKKNNFKIPS